MLGSAPPDLPCRGRPATEHAHTVAIRASSGRHRGVIGASSGRHPGVIGASSGRHRGVIRASSGRHRWPSEARTSGQSERTLVFAALIIWESSYLIRESSYIIWESSYKLGDNQSSSVALRGNQSSPPESFGRPRTRRCNQVQSGAIRCHQVPSGATRCNQVQGRARTRRCTSPYRDSRAARHAPSRHEKAGVRGATRTHAGAG